MSAGMNLGSEKPEDLSFQPRTRLVKNGFKALGEGNYQKAMDFFGAAIRKARRIRQWDLQAEFYKFVTLYLMGEYSQAVQRCVACLDSLKMIGDQPYGAAMPIARTRTSLERCLLQAMVMRGDGFWQIFSHLNKVYKGEYYLMKGSRTLLDSLSTAWSVHSNHITISYEILKPEMETFSKALVKIYEKAPEYKDEEKKKATKVEEAKKRLQEDEKDREAEREELAFLAEVEKKGIVSIEPSEQDHFQDLCEHSGFARTLIKIGQMISDLGPNSQRQYLLALARNKILTEGRVDNSSQDLNYLRERILTFIERNRGG